jgi:peroxiredoxin
LDAELALTTQILALSPDDAEGGQTMVDRVTKESGGPPGFPLLGDSDFGVINRYGVFNPDGFDGRRVPHPAVYVIDRSGTVVWKFLSTDATVRAENEDVVMALERTRNE